MRRRSIETPPLPAYQLLLPGKSRLTAPRLVYSTPEGMILLAPDAGAASGYPQLTPESTTSGTGRGHGSELPQTAAAQVKITDPHIAALTEALQSDKANHLFIGQSRALRQVEAELAQVARTDLTT